MLKRYFLAVVGLFIIWSLLDFVIHGLILADSYKATAEMWRPMDEMKMALMYSVTLVYAVVFVCIYAGYFTEKNMATGLKYGLLFGLAGGISMGYGSYSVMPIPYNMAHTWFWGMIVEGAVGGLLLGFIFNNGKGESAN